MELLSVILIIIILIIIINQNSKLSQHFQKLEAELKSLRKQLLNFTGEKKEDPEIKTPEVNVPAEEQKPYKSIFTVADEQAPVILPSSSEAEIITTAEGSAKNPEPGKENLITTVEVKETITAPKII